MPEAVLTPNAIEHLAVLDYRIERLEALIAAGRGKGVATLDLEQALAMCRRNRTLMYADGLGPVAPAAAGPAPAAEEAQPKVLRGPA